MTIPAYPLEWPAGWKRTPRHHRAAAKFSKARESGQRWQTDLSVNDGVQRLLRELGHMGISGDDLVISTNVELRLDGLPKSGQREPDDPGVAVYWRSPTGEIRCMAIDRYDRVADNLAAIAATLDAMRAIERHGGAAILDRAFTGFTALPPPIAGAEPWYVVLHVFADADHSVIERAYRYERSNHHPDRGGDPAMFDRVQRAWQQYLEQRK